MYSYHSNRFLNKFRKDLQRFFGRLNLIFLLLFLVLLHSSCKKEDQSDPLIIFRSPNSLISVQLGDSVQVIASISDNETLKMVSVQLLTFNFIPVQSTQNFEPDKNNFELNTYYLIHNPDLVSGTYLLSIRASDGTNTSYAYREIEVLALPEQLKSILVLTRRPPDGADVYKLDSSGTTSALVTVPDDYLASGISSSAQQLYVLGENSGGFSMWDANSGAFQNSIPPLTPGLFPTFTGYHQHDELSFIAYYNGDIKAYNNLGQQRFEAPHNGFYRPRKLYRSGDYLFAEVFYSGVNQNRLAVIFYPGGAPRQEYLLDMSVQSMSVFSADELLIFGQRNGRAIVRKYEIAGNSSQVLRDFGAYELNAVIKIRTHDYLLATNQGLFLFRADLNQLSPIDAQPLQGVKYDPLQQKLYYLRNRTVEIASAANYQIISSINFPDSVLDLHFLYNR